MLTVLVGGYIVLSNVQYIDIDATYELISLVMKLGIWVASWARMTQFCLDRFDESGDILCQRYWAVLRQICAKHLDFGAITKGDFLKSEE